MDAETPPPFEQAARILSIEILPGQIETFRVTMTTGGTVVVDRAALNNFDKFNLESISQIRRSFPEPKRGVWPLEVDKALRAAGEPAPPETERMHRYGTDSWGSEETPWLVHNRIPERGYGSLVGSTSTYKSFQLLEMAGCVITGMNYLKAPVRRRGGVLILAPEGAYDIPLRWAAWVKEKMNPDLFRPGNKLPFTYNGYCRPLVKPSTVDWIVKVAQAEQAYFQNEFGVDLVLIGIDTLTAAAGWVESESSSAEGQMLMNNLDAVSVACKNFVMTADHFGKDESAEARGTSVKITSPPTLLYMKGGAKQSITLRKSRSGPQGLEFPFDMKTVDMGTDSFGAPKTSLVVDWNVTRTVAQRASGSRSVFDQALTETFVAHRENITVDGAGAVDAVREFHLRGAFRRLYKAQKQEENPQRAVTSHAINSAWNRAVEKALERTLKTTPGPGGADFFYHPPSI